MHHSSTAPSSPSLSSPPPPPSPTPSAGGSVVRPLAPAPVVLSASTGAVRRMRSVIELRLGPLATSLDKNELLALASKDWSDHLSGSISDGDGGAQFDVFGIEIPEPRPVGRPRVVTIAQKRPDDLDLSTLMC